MKPSIQTKLQNLSHRLEEVTALLGSPEATADIDNYRKLTREHAELTPIVDTYHAYTQAQSDLADAQEMLSDPEMKDFAFEEIQAAKDTIERLDLELQKLLLPKDADDDKNIFIEIRAGTGGDEAALFAGDLLRMYSRYAERNRWQVEIVSANESDLGGYKEVIVRLIGLGAYSKLKFESGGHRVQRVPATESQGRIHTSACTVAVMPEADELEENLADLLAPRDPHDGDDIVMEIKAGAGGEEAALFAGELVRMYQRYADKHGFSTEVLGLSESDLGGVKDMTLSIRSKQPSRDGAWSVFKFEGGVHRVQRVPVTESQGRIQTSAAGVLVYPEPDEIAAVEIDDKDIRVDVYRSSGKGGQGVNTTDSAVRITHLPTGMVVECQDGRSQHANKAQAMKVLAARLNDAQKREAQAKEAAERKSLIGSGDRSERIRTYNYPQGRVTDHRINLTLHKLDFVMDGDLEEITNALIAEHQAELLAAMGD